MFADLLDDLPHAVDLNHALQIILVVRCLEESFLARNCHAQLVHHLLENVLQLVGVRLEEVEVLHDARDDGNVVFRDFLVVHVVGGANFELLRFVRDFLNQVVVFSIGLQFRLNLRHYLLNPLLELLFEESGGHRLPVRERRVGGLFPLYDLMSFGREKFYQRLVKLNVLFSGLSIVDVDQHRVQV